MTSPTTQLMLEALENRWKKYRIELKRCRVKFSNEAVHDVRVALRRLHSLIQLLNSIEPRPRLRKLSSGLKAQLDEFDDLRDTQVMLAETSKTIQELPELENFQGYLEKLEKRSLKDLRKRLRKFDLKEITRRVRKIRESLEAENEVDFAAPILRSVDEAFLIARKRYERIDPAHPKSIHRLRVAFKKFRYMVEIAFPLLDDFPSENIKQMHDYQSLMGEIQDANVFLQTLDDFQTNASFPTPEPVRCFYESRHADAISAYLLNRDVLNDFWRLAPDQPFPWEKK